MTVRGTLGLQTGSRCMETTIRSVISSPSTSDNDPRLSYIWMYVSWDRYRDTYLDIWVRRVIIIRIDTVMNIVMILDIPGMFPVMFPVVTLIMISMILVMIPVLTITCSCFGFIVVPAMYSRFDYRMICNSDSIRLISCGMR